MAYSKGVAGELLPQQLSSLSLQVGQMSTSTNRTHSPAGAASGGKEDDDDAMREECPICKTRRYLRRDMRFLFNPECYHRMCESCVDRIFSHGPRPCPVAECNKVLRRNKFREPMFNDMAMEREIDIRRSIAAM